jgi:predicted DNA-binding transcriptional regulator YafY
MRQMDRRLLILMRLREETPVRAQDLAEECGCAVRTIYRDFDALSQAGVPVAAMPGEGYRLVPGYHLPPVAFTADEAVQLLLGADIAKGIGTAAQREAVRSAAVKVEAVLSPETRADVRRLRERIRVSQWMPHEPSPLLPVFQDAVVHQRVVALRYHSFSPDSITERRIEPHGLVYYSNDWHVVAYCRLREGVRDFRIGRVLEAELLDETFERSGDIKWWADDFSHATEVRVWIDEPSLAWAREQPAFGFMREERAEDDRGSVFVFEVRDLRRLLPWIMSWGANALVLSPPEVVQQLRDEAAALVKRYRGA